jgi:mannitol-specific phosphotransferase system IIBC component
MLIIFMNYLFDWPPNKQLIPFLGEIHFLVFPVFELKKPAICQQMALSGIKGRLQNFLLGRKR